jgi:PKD repeat protein
VSFTASVPDPVNAPLTVAFSNSSVVEGLVGYFWDFGDGQSSTETSPVHTYATGGTFTITLTATGAGGTQASSQSVTVSAPVSAAFSFSPVSGVPLAIQFTDASTGPVAVRAWDFGDGQTSNEANPQHTYAAGGTYNVTLTVTSIDGVSTNSAFNTVTVAEPVNADFLSSLVPDNSLAVQFTNTSTGPVGQLTWDFGDGQTSNEANPQHIYPVGGTYTVTLTVLATDNVTSDQALQSVTVFDPTPAATATPEPVSADFTFAPSGFDPATIDFTATGTGPIETYSWDFGDGNTGSGPVVSNTFAPGTYTVTLTVASAGNLATDTQSQTVTIDEPILPTEPPAGPDFTLESQNGNVLAIAFSPSDFRLATGNSNGTVTLFDVSGQFALGTLSGAHTDAVNAVAWNTGFIASGSEDGSIALWDPNLLTLTTTLSMPSAVTSLAFNPSGTILASGGSDGTVVLWDLSTFTQITSVTSPGFVYSVAFNPSGSLLAYGAVNGSVSIFDVNAQQPVNLVTVNGAATSVAWSIDGTRLAVASSDGTASIFETNSWTTVGVLTGHSDSVNSISYSPNGASIATGSGDGTVRIWEPFSGTEVTSFDTGQAVVAVAWNNDSGYVASTGADTQVFVWQP